MLALVLFRLVRVQEKEKVWIEAESKSEDGGKSGYNRKWVY